MFGWLKASNKIRLEMEGCVEKEIPNRVFDAQPGLLEFLFVLFHCKGKSLILFE